MPRPEFSYLAVRASFWKFGISFDWRLLTASLLSIFNMAEINKLICISNRDFLVKGDDYHLQCISWKNLAKVANFGDYDGVIFNFTTYADQISGDDRNWTGFKGEDDAFDPTTWFHLLSSKTWIICIGDSTASEACNSLFEIEWLQRPLEYGRITHSLIDTSIREQVKSYLDQVADWKSSIKDIEFSQRFRHLLTSHAVQIHPEPVANTTFKTILGIHYAFYAGGASGGHILWLPALHKTTGFEDDYILRDFFGVSVAQAEPSWVASICLPGESQRLEELSNCQTQLTALQNEIARRQNEIDFEKRWYRLLYDDGHSLEGIVNEAIKFIGGIVGKASKEKEDWRLSVPGHIQAIIEIKGTHKPVFGSPALRSLAQWMDETIEKTGGDVKGIFIGNSNRSLPPAERKKLFEDSSSSLAVVRKMTILRTMDLLCFVILKLLDRLDTKALWKNLFECAGQFDATAYHESLPPEFKIMTKKKTRKHASNE